MKMLLFKYLTYMTDVLGLMTLGIVASRDICVDGTTVGETLQLREREKGCVSKMAFAVDRSLILIFWRLTTQSRFSLDGVPRSEIVTGMLLAAFERPTLK